MGHEFAPLQFHAVPFQRDIVLVAILQRLCSVTPLQSM